MCEWLSRAEWCDVQLLCSGHSFSAHRAVLASVSTYLRDVLLSCPSKDSPAYIILPDFDLDAVSSVLYYIYHGEVVIQQCQIKKFLDIIRNLEIYIDPQYLFKISNDMEKSLDLRVERRFANNDDTSSDVNNECRQDANMKNGIKNIMRKVQCSFDGFYFRDKQIRCTRSGKFSSSAGDLVLRCEDRQRGSSLRDLFIETYAGNGNGNGLEAGVLAITNEHYRGPASVLITNANAGHPNETLAGTHKIVSEIRSYISPVSNRFLPSCERYMPQSESFIKSFIEINRKVDVKSITENRRKQDLWMKNVHLPMIFKNNFIESKLRMSRKNIDASDRQVEEKEFLESNPLTMLLNGKTISITTEDEESNSNRALARRVFLNEVLESPWCPRLPYFYKPFRRKPIQSIEVNSDKNQIDVVNDKNNNINESSPSVAAKDTENNSNSEIRDAPTSRPRRLSARDDLKCTTCNQVFTSEESFTTHMRRHSVTRYTCGECYKTFSQLRNFKYHMSVHRGTKEFATTCPVCGKYFNDRGYLSSHMKIHRNRKEYKCPICPKSFNQRVAYNMHVRIHTGVKPHVCSECGKAFSRKMLLKQHERTHSGERPYACPHCEKRFADRSNMTLHLRLHTGVKPFSCSLCPKSFTKKHHLKSHLNFHTGAKPYSCPRCQLAFTQSSNMRTHLKKCNAPGNTT